MAKHRRTRRSAAAPVFVAGATAAISTALALGHATNATAATIPTADTVIGVGGWRNPTSDRIPNKFEGALVAPGQPFVGVRYPAQLPVDPSVAAGQEPLDDAVDAADGSVLIVGYSEGSLVAERYKRALVADGAPDVDGITFLFIAAPFVPNGGVYSRFPGLRLPGFTSTGAAAPSPYDETFVTLEYDLIGDFPAYANPLSLANAVAGLIYVHGDQGPDNVDLESAPQSVMVVTSDAGGTDTYVLIRAEHLPLLRPIRDLAAATGTTAVVEPFVGAVEPTLRLLVDMGYTDRDYRTVGVDEKADYQDADQPTRFSVITPPDRIVETASALPDALRDGAQNFVDALPSAPAVNTRVAKKKQKQVADDLRDDAEAVQRTNDDDESVGDRDSGPRDDGSAKTEPADEAPDQDTDREAQDTPADAA
ncbi:PE-PPE domain-containing protein [Mycobacterium sp. IS-1496]|uniref:PE-PPE domain-containing protein n=1 Tax=Mycobacterium sp. IS-1496 TaxID=1772284 RepID=UPI000AF41BE1|nr:PE-PPE domain-containing protein [Mycobacterium sp. IS-1496]